MLCCGQLWEKIPPAYKTGLVFTDFWTDFWKAYQKVVPDTQQSCPTLNSRARHSTSALCQAGRRDKPCRAFQPHAAPAHRKAHPQDALLLQKPHHAPHPHPCLLARLQPLLHPKIQPILPYLTTTDNRSSGHRAEAHSLAQFLNQVRGLIRASPHCAPNASNVYRVVLFKAARQAVPHLLSPDDPSNVARTGTTCHLRDNAASDGNLKRFNGPSNF